jgi:hypothetical protein
MNTLIIPQGTVEITTRNGQYRLHAPTCRDLPKERRMADDVVVLDEVELGTYRSYLYGDIATDRYAWGTDDWAAEVETEFNAQVTILPCVKLR